MTCVVEACFITLPYLVHFGHNGLIIRGSKTVTRNLGTLGLQYNPNGQIHCYQGTYNFKRLVFHMGTIVTLRAETAFWSLKGSCNMI